MTLAATASTGSQPKSRLSVLSSLLSPRRYSSPSRTLCTRFTFSLPSCKIITTSLGLMPENQLKPTRIPPSLKLGSILLPTIWRRIRGGLNFFSFPKYLRNFIHLIQQLLPFFGFEVMFALTCLFYGFPEFVMQVRVFFKVFGFKVVGP